jgi:riboflavin synthase
MFTGIIEGIGKIAEKKRTSQGDAILSVVPPFSAEDCTIGESIAIDGVCLTITEIKDGLVFMDVSEETLRRSTLSMLGPGDAVNVERALLLSDRLGGHLVLGHVDGIGKIVLKEQVRRSWLVRIELEEGLCRYIVEKGSVAVDGISLTVNRVEKNFFEVNIIPETARQTTLLNKRIEFVNIETDIIGKYVEKFLNSIKLKTSDSEITLDMLKKYGFM